MIPFNPDDKNLTIFDWRTPKYIEFPCPVCKSEMKRTMELPFNLVYECQVKDCTGRMVTPRDQKGVGY